MTRCSMLLVAALSVALVPALMAAEKGGHGGKPGGVIKSVDAKALTLVVTVGKDAEAKDVTYTLTDKTTVSVDKKEAKLEDLKEGMRVMVTADDKNVATDIKAWTGKPKKESK